jgi:RAMP superfamily
MIRDLIVELVSPTMVGGAVKGSCDEPPSLRPPSLRGQLRFWSRALGGGELERKLWGEFETGQRVRLLLARARGPRGRLKEPVSATLIPSRKYRADMVPPGDEVLLRFAVPDEALLDPLRAVVWTWLHLGAVGRRSRRGYGSLLWRPAAGDLLAGWPPLWPSRHLANREGLEKYLGEGFEHVRAELGVPVSKPRTACADERLTSLDQIFVGKELEGEWDAAGGGGGKGTLEALVHGRNEQGRGGELERRQLGSGKPRKPSPMLWRIFPVAGKRAYRAVLTWFPAGYDADVLPQIDRSSGLYAYLHGDLGFDKSLTAGELGVAESEEPE